MQAPQQLKDRLHRLFQSDYDASPVKQFLLHAMVLLDCSEGWREYLIYIEDDFSKLVSRVFEAQYLY